MKKALRVSLIATAMLAGVSIIQSVLTGLFSSLVDILDLSLDIEWELKRIIEYSTKVAVMLGVLTMLSASVLLTLLTAYGVKKRLEQIREENAKIQAEAEAKLKRAARAPF